MSGDTVVANNTASRGGGMYVESGTFRMLSGKITNNAAVSGGGVYVSGGSVELLGGTISDNVASGNGGGVWVTDTTTNLNRLTVANGVVFSNNLASGAYDRNPAHNSYYNTYIGSNVTWTEPFIQGYNNYDISYVNGPQILYHINYNPNTATGTMNSTAAIYNQNVTLKPNTFDNPGYTFAGWNTAADGTGEDYANSQTFTYTYTYDLELYAQWVAVAYGVVYDANGGSGAPVDDALYGAGDLVVVLSGVPTRSGYLFAGWLYNDMVYVGGDRFTMPEGEGDVVLMAQWRVAVIYYSVVYEGNGFTGGMVPLGGSYPAGYSVLVASQGSMVCEGYIFQGWAYRSDAKTPDFAAGSTSYLGLTGDVTLFAVWFEEDLPSLMYTVTYLPGEHGDFEGVSFVCALGDLTPEVSLVPGRSGWRFVGWVPVPTLIVEGDATYVAQWEQEISPSPSPTASPTPTSTPLPTLSPSPTPTRLPTSSPSPTPTRLPTLTPTPTPTSLPSLFPSPSVLPPGGNVDEGLVWALVNLIVSVAGVILAVILMLYVLLQRKQKEKNAQTDNYDDDDGEFEEQKRQYRNLWLVVVFAMGIAGIVVFLFTEDLTRPMGFVDSWTVVNVLIFAVQILALVFAFKRKEPFRQYSQH